MAAYRDRDGITDRTALGAPVESDAQKIDTARARAALDGARRLAETEQQELETTRRLERLGPVL